MKINNNKNGVNSKMSRRNVKYNGGTSVEVKDGVVELKVRIPFDRWEQGKIRDENYKGTHIERVLDIGIWEEFHLDIEKHISMMISPKWYNQDDTYWVGTTYGDTRDEDRYRNFKKWYYWSDKQNRGFDNGVSIEDWEEDYENNKEEIEGS